jgi:PadR family transcriptional regulator, regulatory protein PadR
MPRSRPNPDFLNGVPELVILQLLARRPMYGYELVEAIRDATDRVLTFGEGCVYPILHRLEAEGQVAGRREVANGRSRVVYRLTRSGQKGLARSVAQWRRVAQAVSQIVKGDDHGRPVFA